VTLLESLLIFGPLIVGMLLSALFSGFETGVYTLNRLRLQLLRDRGEDPRAKILGAFVQREDLLLCVFLVGNNIANILVGSLAEVFVGRTLSDPSYSAIVTTVVVTPVLFITSEALPKQLFRVHAETWPYAVSRGLLWSRRILAPLVVLVLPVSRIALRWAHARRRGMQGLRRGAFALERLFAAADERIGSLRETALDIEERSRQPIRELMRGIDEVEVLGHDARVSDLIDVIQRRPFHRFPMRDLDGNYGWYVHYLDPYLGGEAEPSMDEPLRPHAHPIVDLAHDLPLNSGLARLEETGSRVGLVRGQDGDAIGFVFARDLVAGLLAFESRAPVREVP
jgi:Mg2+/Co2+ transporter CorB